MADSNWEPEMYTSRSSSSLSTRLYATTSPFISRLHPFGKEANASFNPILQGKTRDGLNCSVMHNLEEIIQSISIDHSAIDESDLFS